MKIKNENSLYFGIERTDKNSIIDNAKFWKKKKMYSSFAEYLIEFLHNEFKFGLDTEFARKIQNECKQIGFFQSIVIYHEIIACYVLFYQLVNYLLFNL